MSARTVLVIAVAISGGCAVGSRQPAPIEDRMPAVKPAPPAVAAARPTPAVPPPGAPVVRPLPDRDTPAAVPIPLEPAPALEASGPPVFRPANPAVGQLIAEADAAASAGDYSLARAQIERGLKLSPDDPLLWHQLARVNFAAGDMAQARSMAERSTSLAARQPALAAQNWALIGDIETRLGNTAAANDAFARARAGGYGQ